MILVFSCIKRIKCSPLSLLNYLLHKFRVPEGSRFLEDTSYNLHLAAVEAEPSEVIQILSEEVAVHLNENLIHHKRCHDAQ